ncbi:MULTISPECIES: hypothetical protein [unclassified Clostridium]|uniref:hypothetical protein n=1 Tax=unclassified Clostridium TaxID=2614128 RepID=UPI0002982DF4|nr:MULTISPECIES: hypothetical protein [unclassified Clostridium]EKQ58034.1 MAG: hypothetical protein A370_00332 [Clostridium sp. Maddingley MBC34-26]
MKWEEVRTIYPNKFVLLKSLEDHIENNKKCIDDVAVVRVLDDEEASNLLVKCKGDTFVFHTSKEKLSMNIIQMPILRGAFK